MGKGREIHSIGDKDMDQDLSPDFVYFNCETLGKLLNLSEAQCPHLQK